ncbi:MAG TPA: hypothetical protein VH375_10795 [Rhodanobacteraceae bacterium]
MTDSQILALAKAAVPEHIRPLGRIVQRHDIATAAAPAPGARAAPPKDTVIADLAKRVGAKPKKKQPDSADVEFPEHTALGLRTTVVHIRNGKVARVLKRG